LPKIFPRFGRRRRREQWSGEVKGDEKRARKLDFGGGGGGGGACLFHTR